jgi:hypothetical protein
MNKNKIIIFLSVLVAVLFVSLLFSLSLNNQKTKIVISPPTPTTSPIEWEVYKNEKYQFSFMYPSTETVEIVGGQSLLALNMGGVTISVLGNPEKLSLSSWLSKNQSLYFSNYKHEPILNETDILLFESSENIKDLKVTPDFVYIIESPKTNPFYYRLVSSFNFSKKYASLGEACLGSVSPEYSIDCEPNLVCEFPKQQKPGDRGVCVKSDR